MCRKESYSSLSSIITIHLSIRLYINRLVTCTSTISESTVVLCRDGTEKNGRPYISIASDDLKSLVIYTDKFNTTYIFISSVFMTTNIF